MATATVESRIDELDKTRKKVLNVVEIADQILKELSNDHPSTQSVKSSTTTFASLLESIERELTQHINHLLSVTKEQQQEQVTYTQEKDCELALMRVSQIKKMVEKAIELHRSPVASTQHGDIEPMDES
ncbi:Mediator of RNA polymerase II transcription subunit 11 [Trichoplax sp. H2]|uniref:Mediator of RNA polymerase II transcription subunit 11 n=1 Tax=Trichoplax adhaerens TaxID=10228 RepID=B3RPT2_TRIAD|nr:hypothetical protein TRIADDRAFT_53652 [Trichoplax adhaerens]EDV27694.1 hypothetical protein TRIADDRAFT_53652 [Trichoplax adhaerens]RDD45245.1 Mediator of RNA polymerase II transcription subunit 11 [Trichoplax sp. H2]|eukprot:XP_002109528.1 hypothetical protein TRIADDRAFT_53652 [Trichoplax adhaerens]